MSLRGRFLSAVAATTMLLGAISAQAAVWYVSPSGNDANSGASWALAKATPQSAVTASASGDQIWVKTGTYTMLSAVPLVTLKAGVSLYGGFAGTETLLSQRNAATAAANTIFDGAQFGAVVKATGTLTSATIMDGFTIQNGKNTVGGGGLYFSSNGTLVLQNLIVKNNTQTGSFWYGGGLYSSSTYPSILNCTFSNNYSGSAGNSGYGGALYVSGSSATIINANLFAGNTATYYGGCGYLTGTLITFSNNIVTGNTGAYAGGLYVTSSSKIWNNTIYNNTATTANVNGYGGGIYITSSTVSVGNNIIANNTNGGVYSSISAPIFKNNDVFGNTVKNIYGITTVDPSNIAGDPGLNNPGAGDFSLNNASAAVDAGSATYVYGSTDYAGNPRIFGGAPDMGAMEKQSAITTAPPPSFNPGAGTYSDYTNVVVTGGASGETIYYTTDGSTPTNSSPTVASGGTVAIATSETLKAFATKSGLLDSPVTSAVYTLTAATPVFSPDSSAAPQTVTITSATTSAVIYYTTDGSTPSPTNGTLYTAPVTVSGPNTTLKAVATKSGLNNSAVKTATYRTNSTTIYVDKAVGNDSNDGSSWATAKKTIANAMTAAYVVGDQIFVASGTYAETITLKVGVQLYGGFLNGQTLANRNFRTNVTTINASGSGKCITVAPQAGNDTIIDGFTITNGTSYGGGIYCSSASPTIQNNTITANAGGSGDGGGIYASTAPTSGQPVVIQNNIITNNQGSGALYGGGIAIEYTNGTVVNNLIAGTTTGCSEGGGVYISGSTTYTVTLVNNTIANNASTGAGGGIYISSAVNLVLANNIIAFNTAATNGSGIYSSPVGSYTLMNNDVYSTGVVSNYYNVSPGTGDISQDPLFVGPPNYQLTNSSPCIDSGDDASYAAGYPATDAAGNTRVKYSHIDMGAFENQVGLTQTPTPVFSPNGGLSPVTVTVTDNSPTAVIYYTTNGSTPTTSSPQVANGGTINIPAGTTTLKAFAKSPGLSASGVATAIYRSAATIYVDTATGNDSNSGLTWAAPKKTIGAGLSAATIVGDQVWVAAGTYAERVTVPVGAILYGGFLNGQTLANRNFRANVSSINASTVTPAGSPVTISPGADNNTLIDGFTITGSSSTYGGIYSSGAAPTITDNTITGNSFSSYGGGIYYYNTSTTLTSAGLIQNNIISNNVATSSSQYGGGIYHYTSSSSTGITVTIVNNLIINNGAYIGGGIYTSGTAGTIVNNTIANNVATGNLASTTSGAGIYVSSGSPIVENNIVAFNTTGITSYTTTLTENYNDVYSNGSVNYSGTAAFAAGPNDVNLDPAFVNAAGGNYQLGGSSAAIDAGDNSVVPAGVTTDLAGNNRVAFGTVDDGAYESQTGLTQTQAPVFNPNGGASPATVTVTDVNSSAVIYYTTNGSTPTTSSATVANGGTISIPSGTTTLKASAKAGSLLMSTVTTALFRDPAVIYVDAAVGNDANSGLAWNQAKQTITAGLTATTVPGDKVYVAAGNYAERITLPLGAKVYGGFLNGQTLATRNFRTNISTINGGAAGACVTFTAQADNATLIDGFTITNGSNYWGGGVSAVNASPTISNNVITGNNGLNGYGGGVCFENPTTSGTTGLLINNIISNNTGTGALYGGGVCAYYTGMTMVNNIVTGNAGGTPYGGGVYVYNFTGTVTDIITNNTIANNTVTSSGGGVYVASSQINATIANNIIAFNNATTSGSGVYASSATNVMLMNNDVYGTGSTTLYQTVSPGAGDISLDPQFVSSTNYQLNNSSPCIDAGDDASYTAGYPSVDAAGNTRVKFSHIDMGALENQSGLTQTPTPSFNPNGGLSPATVTVTDNNPSAIIYYTTNGSTPTTSSPTVANGGTVSIPAGTYTLKAIAKAPGLSISAVATAVFRSAATIYVDGVTGNDSNTGLAWNQAKLTITGGLAAATISGDQVFVAKGTYAESITLKDGVKMYGGFVNGQTLATRNFRTNVTKIDMTGVSPAGAVVTAPAGISNATIFDGFTVTGGTTSGIYTNGGSPTISNDIITGNSVSGSGGGLMIQNLTGQDVIVYNCIFSNNTATSFGGAIYINNGKHGTVANCLFTGNVGGSYGGAIEFESTSVGTIVNCTFSGNSLSGVATSFANGGAIDVYNATATLANNIIVNNAGYNGGGLSLTGTAPTVTSTDNDFWNNTGNTGTENYSTNFTPDAGSISSDPLFVNAAGGNFRLTSGSPCVNSGDNASVPTFSINDLDGNARIVGSAVDMGAYELQAATSITFTGTVKLQGWIGTTLPQIKVKVDGGTATTVTLTPVSTNTGTFTVALPTSGSHTVNVKPNGFLSQTATLTTTGGPASFTFDGGTANNNAGMIPGDLNNDNVIDDSDLLVAINNFLNPPPTGTFDGNGDNVLDDTDLLDVINNFLAVGS